MTNAKLKVKILTIFPECFPGTLALSLIGKAKGKNWDMQIINIRDYATDKHSSVDDTTYGGGNGMIMRPDVLGAAIEDNLAENQKIIYLSPKGELLKQQKMQELSKEQNIMLICRRFEGIDQRLIDYYNISEISIGDYVLAGGEVAAQVLLEGVIRLKLGTLENTETTTEDSFSGPKYSQLLEYPQYTKPKIWKNLEVPEILQSGNHAAIKEWRYKTALKITKQRRPDL